jgi:3-dehydroquinate dehydratase/shikimate dehydrogenase
VSLVEEPICVVIGRTRHRMVQQEIIEAGELGARFIELRLDFLAKAPDFKRLLEYKTCPMVATVRRTSDGGRFNGSEDARKTLLRQAIVSGFEWVDLETDIASSIPRFGKVKRIVSYHNLRETPKDLEGIHAQMCQQDADVVKLAVRAQSPADNLRVLDLLKNPPRPTVAHCMGDLGLPSRILGAKFDAPFTYAAHNKERGIAPGLPSYLEMKKLYHYDRIRPSTRIFGVIGDPIAHSLSPLIHNKAFRTVGLDAVYIPFRVPKGELPAFLKAFDALPVEGYSVTIPQKEVAAIFATERDPSVEGTKAANTLVRKGSDRFSAYNTDFTGVLSTLYDLYRVDMGESQPPLTGREALRGRPVLILGAGGVARAVAYALVQEGALPTIVNRTPERAHKLAEELSARHVDWAARHTVISDLVINCTSVGMHPNIDESPLHPSFLKPGLTVFDTVYTPETTLLVKEARARGCRVITGVELFIRQAVAQFELFTGRGAPVEKMTQWVRKALSPVKVRDDEGPKDA